MIRKLTYFIALCLIPLICLANPLLEDNAKVISPQVIEKSTQLLNDTQAKDRLRIDTIILPNFYGKSPNAIYSAYYQNMLKTAGNIDNLVLFIVVLENNQVRVIPSPNLSNIFTAQAIQDITANVTKQLETKNYDEMTKVGIARILHFYHEKVGVKETPSPYKNILNIILFIVVMVVVIYLIRKKPISGA